MEERLQKLLSAAGVCSRRRGEELLAAGRVTVNGRPAQVGDKADRVRDAIAVDGRPLFEKTAYTYLMLNKPRGVVTTLDDERGRPTVATLVADCGTRVWPVGRLDLDSEGLLLLTDDGELTHRLTHPSWETEKEYQVTVNGPVEESLPTLNAPMTVDGAKLRAARVAVCARSGERTVLSVVIHEGKNRQIRRMCAQVGLAVLRLQRVREGAVALDPALAPGKWRYLTSAEVCALGQAHSICRG